METIRFILLKYGYPLTGGFLVGIAFRLMRLPIPAPSVFEGILGIIGIFLGYKLTSLVK